MTNCLFSFSGTGKLGWNTSLSLIKTKYDAPDYRHLFSPKKKLAHSTAPSSVTKRPVKLCEVGEVAQKRPKILEKKVMRTKNKVSEAVGEKS